jgi:hypothetical protein
MDRDPSAPATNGDYKTPDNSTRVPERRSEHRDYEVLDELNRVFTALESAGHSR